MRYLPSALAKLRTHYRPGCHLINQTWETRTNLILVCGRENHQIIGVTYACGEILYWRTPYEKHNTRDLNKAWKVDRLQAAALCVDGRYRMWLASYVDSIPSRVLTTEQANELLA